MNSLFANSQLSNPSMQTFVNSQGSWLSWMPSSQSLLANNDAVNPALAFAMAPPLSSPSMASLAQPVMAVATVARPRPPAAQSQECKESKMADVMDSSYSSSDGSGRKGRVVGAASWDCAQFRRQCTVGIIRSIIRSADSVDADICAISQSPIILCDTGLSDTSSGQRVRIDDRAALQGIRHSIWDASADWLGSAYAMEGCSSTARRRQWWALVGGRSAM